MPFRIGKRSPRRGGTALADTNPEVARAEALATDGRLFDAIDVLTTENRRLPDPAIEERLVGLRHEAFGQLDASGGPVSWPPPVDDQFPNAVGPPEVAKDELTPEALRSGIFHHGCLKVRSLFDETRVNGLVDDIDHAFDAQQRRVDGAPVSETAPWYVPYEPFSEPDREWARQASSVIAVDSPRGLFRIIEVFEEAGIGDLVAGFLGERPALLGIKWTLRRVPPDIRLADWHQDGSFMGADIRSLNLWVALTECGDDAPSMDIVPRRFESIVERGTHGAILDWAVGPGMAEQVAQGTIMRPRFAPGDALLFDQFFLHRTDTHAGMTRPRHAIEAWFAAPSSYPPAQMPIAY
jgi:hypothetical protein